MEEAPQVWSYLAKTAIALLLLFCGQTRVAGQAISDSQVKAAYLYNFAKFVEWPAADFASPEAPIRFCVLDDSAFESELNHIINGKLISGRPLVVVAMREAEKPRGCQILFINSSHDKHLPQILGSVQNTSVLTVGETKGFVEEGGIINFINQNDRIQFQVNDKAARQAGIHISSRLLVVAKLVIQ